MFAHDGSKIKPEPGFTGSGNFIFYFVTAILIDCIVLAPELKFAI